MWAAWNDQSDCVRLLIDAGADKDAKNCVRLRLLLCCGASSFLFHPQGYRITFQFSMYLTVFSIFLN